MNNTEYTKILNLLKKDENLFAEFTQVFPPKNEHQIKSMYKCSQEFKSFDVAKELLSPTVLKQINSILTNKPKYGGHGKKLPKLLKRYEDMLSDEIKQRIVKKVSTPMKEFYPYAKRDLLDIAVKWIKDEDTTIKVIQQHYRIIDVDVLEQLLTNVSGGIEHESLKKVRETSLPFLARELRKLDLNDGDQRHQVINTVAKTPSLLKQMDTRIHITLEDMQKLPPSRRFDFMRFIYEPKFGNYSVYAKNWWPRSITKARLKKANDHQRYKKITIDPISRDDVKNLLFAVSIRKNGEVKIWYDRYDEYLRKAKSWGML